MKNFLTILLLLIIDVLVIWIWFYIEDPDPSGSIVLILIIPFIILVNILIAGLLWMLNKKFYSKYFIINSVFASIIAYFLWPLAIQRHQDQIWEIYSFEFNQNKYIIHIYKADDTFDIYESLNSGSSWTYQDGIIKRKDLEIILITDSTKYIIKNDSLSGFTQEKIKLKKE